MNNQSLPDFDKLNELSDSLEVVRQKISNSLATAQRAEQLSSQLCKNATDNDTFLPSQNQDSIITKLKKENDVLRKKQESTRKLERENAVLRERVAKLETKLQAKSKLLESKIEDAFPQLMRKVSFQDMDERKLSSLEKMFQRLLNDIAKVRDENQAKDLCFICVCRCNSGILLACGHFYICSSCSEKNPTANCPLCHSTYQENPVRN